MGIALRDVHIYHGDTAVSPYAMIGTGGSRAATMASGSVLHSTRQVKEKVLAIAGEMLEVGPQDLRIDEGYVYPAGVPSIRVSLAEVADRAYQSPQDLPTDIDTLSKPKPATTAHRKLVGRHPSLPRRDRPGDRPGALPAIPRRRGLRPA